MATIHEKMTAIGDAIREKTGGTELLSLDDMAVEIAGISTGVELNFEVVGGTTEPANPVENMIWVNTDAEITNYEFSATEPANPLEGMVWVSVGTSSTVAFNALKKNGIQVYPLSAKQYVNGVWVDKIAKSYQGGEWVNWITYYFRTGTGTIVEFEASMQTNGVCTIGTDKITFSKNADFSNVSCACTKDEQKLIAGNVVIFDAKCTWQNTDESGKWSRVVGIYSSKPDVNGLSADNAVSVVYLEADSVRKQYKVPVENDGMYYIASCGSGNAEIYDIYSQ